jgi:hypothetical protein
MWVGFDALRLRAYQARHTPHPQCPASDSDGFPFSCQTHIFVFLHGAEIWAEEDHLGYLASYLLKHVYMRM